MRQARGKNQANKKKYSQWCVRAMMGKYGANKRFAPRGISPTPHHFSNDRPRPHLLLDSRACITEICTPACWDGCTAYLSSWPRPTLWTLRAA
jgi:hypothetical protein